MYVWVRRIALGLAPAWHGLIHICAPALICAFRLPIALTFASLAGDCRACESYRNQSLEGGSTSS